MELKSELVVKVDDATFYFDEITYKEYLEGREAASKGEQEKHVFSKLRRIEGLTNNGQPVTPEGLRTFEIPFSLYLKIVNGYWAESQKLLRLEPAEAEPKKESDETPAPSSSAS